jgi:N-hydroxyarylamine O-acetyltransferase
MPVARQAIGTRIASLTGAELLQMDGQLNLNAYFERIGFSGSIAPTLATLEALHALHPAAIAFENLDSLMGVPIRLDLKSLQHKLVVNRRGGYCLEHNSLFRAVLAELGYTVSAHAARVLWGMPEGAPRPVSHMVLTVEIGGARYLADVGFGGNTLTAPLRLKTEIEQQTPHEAFRILAQASDYRVEIRIGEAWHPLYQFDLAERGDVEFEAMNEMVSGLGGSMTGRLIASRPEPGRRLTLSNDRFSIHPTGGETETRRLTGIGEMRDVLAQGFGIAPPSPDLLEPVLLGLLGGPEPGGAA